MSRYVKSYAKPLHSTQFHAEQQIFIMYIFWTKETNTATLKGVFILCSTNIVFVTVVLMLQGWSWLSCSCFSAAGCARRWYPLRTLLSQRPPPHCRNGVFCGSSSMWSVAVYYSTSCLYQNKSTSNKCESVSKITKISKRFDKTAFASILASFALF